MTRLESILCGIILLLTIFVLRGCNDSKPESVKLVPTIEYQKGKTDTLYFPDTVYSIKELKPNPVYSIRVDTVFEKLDTSYVYETPFSDSLIVGTIISNVKGQLLSSQLKYSPKFPRFITRVDTLRIKEPVPVVKQKWGVYVGGIVGGNLTSFNVQPAVLIKTDRLLQFSLGYGIIDKSYNIGIFTKINNPFTK